MGEKISERVHSFPWNTPFILVCKARAPYDGCFWEYNYWLQKGRRYYPLYRSGYALKLFTDPLDPPKDPHHLEKNGAREHLFLEWADSTNRYTDWTIEEIDECDVAYNKLNSIAALLHYHGLQGPQWDCSICEETHVGMARFLGYKGNGGIGINLTDPCCSTCFSRLVWCMNCNNSVLPDEQEQCPNCGDETEFMDADSDDSFEIQDEAENFGMDGSRTLSALEVYEPPLSVKLSEA